MPWLLQSLKYFGISKFPDTGSQCDLPRLGQTVWPDCRDFQKIKQIDRQMFRLNESGVYQIASQNAWPENNQAGLWGSNSLTKELIDLSNQKKIERIACFKFLFSLCGMGSVEFVKGGLGQCHCSKRQSERVQWSPPEQPEDLVWLNWLQSSFQKAVEHCSYVLRQNMDSMSYFRETDRVALDGEQDLEVRSWNQSVWHD